MPAVRDFPECRSRCLVCVSSSGIGLAPLVHDVDRALIATASRLLAEQAIRTTHGGLAQRTEARLQRESVVVMTGASAGRRRSRGRRAGPLLHGDWNVASTGRGPTSDPAAVSREDVEAALKTVAMTSRHSKRTTASCRRASPKSGCRPLVNGATRVSPMDGIASTLPSAVWLSARTASDGHAIGARLLIVRVDVDGDGHRDPVGGRVSIAAASAQFVDRSLNGDVDARHRQCAGGLRRVVCVGVLCTVAVVGLTRPSAVGRDGFLGSEFNANVVDRMGYRIRFTAGGGSSTAPRQAMARRRSNCAGIFCRRRSGGYHRPCAGPALRRQRRRQCVRERQARATGIPEFRRNRQTAVGTKNEERRTRHAPRR